MDYTGERMVPSHDGKEAIGNVHVHELMYFDFLPAVKDKIVVDIACGCGNGSKMISETAKQVFSYDISKEAIEFAKKYKSAENISYNVGDIRQIPHEDKSIDTVISVETFEHVENIDQVIQEVNRILKENGVWCFTTPNGNRYPDHRIVKYHVQHYPDFILHDMLNCYFNFKIREIGFEDDVSRVFKTPTFGNYSIFCIKK